MSGYKYGDYDSLRPATEGEIAEASRSRIGFRRFDTECGDYGWGCCAGCAHGRAGGEIWAG